MNIIEFLEMQEPTQQVQIFLYEEISLHMIAYTNARMLIPSPNKVFRSLQIVSVGEIKDTLVVVVIKPH